MASEAPAAAKADAPAANTRGKQDDKTSADYYFDSYSHFGIHEEMLKDTVRTRSYMNAILSNRHLFQGKTVLDVGCGTGILCMFAAKAGAKRVIGVECSSIAEQARQIVKDNGFEGVVTIVQGKLEEISLPDGIDKVDIIVSEWMGYALMYESMLDTVLAARDRWLKPPSEGGAMYPDRARVWLTAIEDAEYKSEKIDFWDNVYGFNMSVIKALAMAEPLVDVVEPDQVVAERPCLLHALDMAEMPPTKGQAPGYASAFSSRFQLTAASNNYIHALVAYFDVEFSACHKPLRFTTGPDARPTHWKQTVFYLEDTLVVKKGETVKGTFTCAPNAQNPRDLDIAIEYELDGAVCKVKRRQEYRMR